MHLFASAQCSLVVSVMSQRLASEKKIDAKKVQDFLWVSHILKQALNNSRLLTWHCNVLGSFPHCFVWCNTMISLGVLQVMALLICRGMYCWNPLKALRDFCSFEALIVDRLLNVHRGTSWEPRPEANQRIIMQGCRVLLLLHRQTTMMHSIASATTRLTLMMLTLMGRMPIFGRSG